MLFFCQTFLQNFSKYSVNCSTNYKNALFFHTITTGHYWRNSYIKELQLLKRVDSCNWKIEIWKTEKEEEEYDLLELLSSRLKEVSVLAGYNSSSFHIPYLTQKYKAYGLEDPFFNLTHYDLLKELKPIGNAFHLSLKLKDLQLYLKLDEQEPEIRCIFEALNLFSFQEVFQGDFSIDKFDQLDQELLVTITSEASLAIPLHFFRPAFYFIGEGTDIRLKIKLYDNRLRVYFPNYKDYYYLPLEDMAIHKSIAASLPKETREKATEETCYTYTPFRPDMTTEQLKKYIKTLFKTIIV